MDAGRIAQKFVISFQQHGLYSLVTPALKDRDVSKLLNLDEANYSPLYSITLGYPVL
ncbi:nitroreductase family protein [Legionella sp.]|uniref:nitroreductase family protein n=1 Tax=Legionella sp. TaxID=459 RepID=UPI0039E41C95